jgi:hypothetical protein
MTLDEFLEAKVEGGFRYELAPAVVEVTETVHASAHVDAT